MNFLVTGGAGFIGSHVCERLLAGGHRVCVLDDLNPYYDPALKRENLDALATTGGERFQFIHGDISDRGSVEAAFGSGCLDQVIHLAARAGVRPSIEEPALYQRVNVEGTVNILEAARRNGVRKIVLASSSSVYGLNAKVPFSESDPLFHPISPYAASKLAGEALGHVYHHLHGLDVAAVRLFTAYGPRQRPDLAIHKFATLMLAGQPIPVFGDGSTARDYTYVGDIADGVLACTQHEFGYEVFNLGGSNAVTLTRLIELLEQSLGVQARLDRQPLQPGDVPITFANVDKAKRMLGYHPATQIEAGLEKFAEWFLRRNPRAGN